MTDLTRTIAEAAFTVLAAWGLLDFIVQVISGGRVQIIRSLLLALFGEQHG